MKKQDRAELAHCISVACEQQGRAEQIKEKLREESWEEVAIFCAECCQERSLHLKPWQIPPCTIENPDDPNAGALRSDYPGLASDGRREAAALLKRMLAAGISRFHPDPLAALDEAERRKAASAQN